MSLRNSSTSVSRRPPEPPTGEHILRVLLGAEFPRARTENRRRLSANVCRAVVVVCVALISKGTFDVFFYYQEPKGLRSLRIQRGAGGSRRRQRSSQFRKRSRASSAGTTHFRGRGLDRTAPVRPRCGCGASPRASPSCESTTTARSGGVSRLAMDVARAAPDL